MRGFDIVRVWKVIRVDMLEQLNGAVKYMERNLRGEVDFEEAAKVACVTKDSFQRFFSYMTGMTATEYIRRRRLTLAGYDLQQGGGRVIDIALRYGYESADAFARAFFRQHGITPSEARKSSAPLKVYPPVSFHITVKGARKMDFRLIDMEETVVYGVSRKFDRQAYSTREALRGSMWSEEGEFIPGRLCEGCWNQPGNHAYDGIWYGVWQDGRYMIAREKECVKPGELEKLVIPGGKYAAFTTRRGGLAWEELPRLFEEIFEAWLPSSGYEMDGDTVIEVYHLWTDHEQRRKNRYYEVLLPVRPSPRKG